MVTVLTGIAITTAMDTKGTAAVMDTVAGKGTVVCKDTVAVMDMVPAMDTGAGTVIMVTRRVTECASARQTSVYGSAVKVLRKARIDKANARAKTSALCTLT